jgi:hypothetical protein
VADPLAPRAPGPDEKASFRASVAGDGALALFLFRGLSGLRHTVLFDPGAQRAGQTLYLVMDGFPRSVQVVAVPGAPKPAGLRDRHTLHKRAEVEDAVRRYRTWQAALRADHDRGQALRAVARLAGEHARAELGLHVPRNVLLPDADDVRLAILWCERRYREPLDRWFRDRGATLAGVRSGLAALESDGAKELREDLMRTLSARVAEKAARWVYAHHGAPPPDEVRDVAAVQLGKPEHRGIGTPEYERYDLAVVTGQAVRLLDVKNARSGERRAEHDSPVPSWAGCRAPRGTYIEHCVPAFKKDRAQTTDVEIAGVFSPLAALREMLDAEYGGEAVTFLGESSEALCGDLKEQFERAGRLVITFGSARVRRRRRDGVFLPPWMFVFPAGWYGEWDERCRSGADAARALGGDWVPDPALWAFCIASGVAAGLPEWHARIPVPWRSFVERLCALQREGRLALPYVYLATLSHFLETLRGVGPGGRLGATGEVFRPEVYRDFLFSKGPTNRPVGLYDPLRSVDGLIGSLILLMRGDLAKIAKHSEFRFSHAGALKAASPDVRTGWATLLFPYCGGGCGREHLVLGATGTDLCTGCGHLICPTPECRFCDHTDPCKAAAAKRRSHSARGRSRRV